MLKKPTNPVDPASRRHPPPPYMMEYMAAMDRTANFGLETPPRVLVSKDCVDPDRTLKVLLDYFGRHRPADLVGQTVAINLALVPILLRATGVPFQLTIGWIEQQGRACFKRDDDLIARFIAQDGEVGRSRHAGDTRPLVGTANFSKSVSSGRREGLPFHIWLTSPACEILDVTFAMNLRWAKTREECAALVIYQPGDEIARNPAYHPTVIGPDFFHKTGGVL